MALMYCPECGHHVSDKANNCPNCGYPIAEFLENNNRRTRDVSRKLRTEQKEDVERPFDQSLLQQLSREPKEKKPYSVAVISLVFAVLAVLCCLSNYVLLFYFFIAVSMPLSIVALATATVISFVTVRTIVDFLPVEPNIITFHYAACKNKEEVMDIIKYIKENNCKVGISVKPNTNIEDIYEFLPFVHLVLIMTVEPGKGGQTLLTDMVNKIATFKKYINENNIEVDVEADGGINLKTASYVKEAGANILVAGSAILAATDYKVIIDELKK